MQRRHHHEGDLIGHLALHQGQQVVARVAGEQNESREDDDQQAQRHTQSHGQTVDRDEGVTAHRREGCSTSHEHTLDDEEERDHSQHALA